MLFCNKSWIKVLQTFLCYHIRFFFVMQPRYLTHKEEYSFCVSSAKLFLYASDMNQCLCMWSIEGNLSPSVSRLRCCNRKQQKQLPARREMLARVFSITFQLTSYGQLCVFTPWPYLAEGILSSFVHLSCCLSIHLSVCLLVCHSSLWTKEYFPVTCHSY